MPDRIKKVWDRIYLLFYRAVDSIRREAENSILIKTIAAHPLGVRFLRDTVFRSGVILYFSLILNFTYGAIQFLVGVYAKSVWLGALATYHILLAGG